MKNKLFWFVLVLVVSVVSVRLVRATQAVPPVFDLKNSSPAACKVQGWNMSITADPLEMILAEGGIGPTAVGNTTTDYVLEVCPIMRDRSVDSVGPRGVWVDVMSQPTQPSVGANTTECWVENNSGRYTDGSGTISIGTGHGTHVKAVISHDVQRLNLPIPYPTGIPQDAWNHGATYADGSSNIVCKIPFGGFVIDYLWTEYGGESTDY